MKERIHLFCLERKTTPVKKMGSFKNIWIRVDRAQTFFQSSACQLFPFPLCVTVGITLLPLEFSREKVP